MPKKSKPKQTIKTPFFNCFFCAPKMLWWPIWHQPQAVCFLMLCIHRTLCSLESIFTNGALSTWEVLILLADNSGFESLSNLSSITELIFGRAGIQMQVFLTLNLDPTSLQGLWCGLDFLKKIYGVWEQFSNSKVLPGWKEGFTHHTAISEKPETRSFSSLHINARSQAHSEQLNPGLQQSVLTSPAGIQLRARVWEPGRQERVIFSLWGPGTSEARRHYGILSKYANLSSQRRGWLRVLSEQRFYWWLKKPFKRLNWQDYELWRVLSYLEGRCQGKL